jgi:hypothetical protein
VTEGSALTADEQMALLRAWVEEHQGDDPEGQGGEP